MGLLKRGLASWWWAALAYLLLVAWPYAFLARAGGEAFVFTGSWMNWPDGLSYLAKMQEGLRGAWRFTLPYTAHPGRGAYLYLFYLTLGHVSRWTHLPLAGVYHAARLLGAFVMVGTLKGFYEAVFASGTHRPWTSRWAWVWALSGGGLGWLALLFRGSGYWTLDFWLADAYPFLGALTNAHFPWVLAGLFWLLTPVPRPLGATALVGLGLALLSPFGWSLGVAVLLAEGVLQWSRAARKSRGLTGWRGVPWPQLGALTLAGAPYTMYVFWVTHTDPVLRGWTAQNLTPLGPWWDVLLSFSPALPLAVLGAWKPHPARRRLLVWAGVSLGLALLPLGLQRRFLLGWYVPLVGLAVLGLSRWPAGRRYVLLAWAFSLPTVLLLFAGVVSTAQQHLRGPLLPRDEARAMAWLEAHTPPDALVLASPQTGPFIPALAGRRVLYGHPMETVDAIRWRELTAAFFAGCLDEAFAHRLLREQGVDYIYYGPEEQALGGFPLAVGVTPVTRIGRVVLYRVEAGP